MGVAVAHSGSSMWSICQLQPFVCSLVHVATTCSSSSIMFNLQPKGGLGTFAAFLGCCVAVPPFFHCWHAMQKCMAGGADVQTCTSLFDTCKAMLDMDVSLCIAEFVNSK